MEKRPLNPTIIESGDGSHTLRVEALKEHYHSHKGAVQESMYVFLAKGLAVFSEPSSCCILEVGFGTGLNALLTLLYGKEHSIHYTSLEAYPLDIDLAMQLNYPEYTGIEGARELFEQLHQSPWNCEVEISAQFFLEKRSEPLQQFQRDNAFDLVYYDAFAPHAQPELWEPEIWEKLYGMMRPNAVLVTYCAKGQVRRDMQAAGFKVERLEGPPGKREMIRATKP